jgi:hypothetical protein
MKVIIDAAENNAAINKSQGSVTKPEDKIMMCTNDSTAPLNGDQMS